MTDTAARSEYESNWTTWEHGDFYRRKRVQPDGTVQYPFRLRWLVLALSRYSMRHFHCLLDGQCIFRARHRGGCSWGGDDDDK